jgi:hypothetical protein
VENMAEIGSGKQWKTKPVVENIVEKNMENKTSSGKQNQ